MKRKNIWKWGVAVVAACVLCVRACAQTVEVKVRVVDQDGKSVAGVKVDCESQEFLRKKEGQQNKYAANLSDEEGIASITSRKRSLSERINLSKNGYYYTRSSTLTPIAEDYPTEEPIKLTIKKIKNSIPLLSKNLVTEGGGALTLPKYNGEKFAYDLFAGDWVTPYGGGKKADIYFKFDGVVSNKPYGSLEQYDNKITISFPNKKDGIIVYKGMSEEGWRYGSDFVSDYEAPVTGYQSEWVQRTWKKKGGYHQTTKDRDRNFYFRVRTKVDEKGNLISAHYGKIYGDFMSFIYYLNPAPNDRNVEFDPSKNLFKGEKVNRP